MSGSTIPVVFNYATWTGRYPEFQNVLQAVAQLYFNEACLYIDNTGRGPITDPNTLTLILYMGTSHIAALNSPKIADQYNTYGTESSPLVGRIASASEGSVNVSVEFPDQDAAAAWWNQTKYGAAAWKAMAPFRTAFYLPSGRRRQYNPPIWGRNMSPW